MLHHLLLKNCKIIITTSWSNAFSFCLSEPFGYWSRARKKNVSSFHLLVRTNVGQPEENLSNGVIVIHKKNPEMLKSQPWQPIMLFGWLLTQETEKHGRKNGFKYYEHLNILLHFHWNSLDKLTAVSGRRLLFRQKLLGIKQKLWEEKCHIW